MLILNLPTTTDDYLLDGLTPGELSKYSRTCKAAYSTVKSYMKRKFQLHNLLERFLTPSEIIHFRKLQCHTGMFISGSTAVQFFDRTVYPDSDLDCYLEHRFCREVAYWLIKIGYKYAPLPESSNVASLEQAFRSNPPTREHVPDPFCGDIFFLTPGKDYFKAPFVFNFEKQNPYRKIQLITSLQSPLERILNFHSTCVMNIITHDKAYALFPRATFEERRSLICLSFNELRDKAIEKYTERGWSFTNVADAGRNSLETQFSFGERYVGDRKCWTLPILPALDLPSGHMEINSWVTKCNSWDEFPSMSYSFLASKTLKFTYLIGIGDDWEIEDFIENIVPYSEDEPVDQEQVKLDDKLRTMIRKRRITIEEEDCNMLYEDTADGDSEPEEDASDSDSQGDMDTSEDDIDTKGSIWPRASLPIDFAV
ncbi:hypothetical protein BDN70DRAFT_897280 [Pholiota conissans]|uniref:F-box domain-containing protein n=1 Tax=Pholiota conissans TaxID=109636 RepID=A0A9P5YVM6_9AGAR|nr:hypothetical protein BDN70DRAFT_897280 [Pholiota conissans]